MGRYSPTVLPDSRPDQRPGLEIANAIDAFRAAKDLEADRAEADTDRTRRREREDVTDATRDIELDELVRDAFGGTPVGETPVGVPTPVGETQQTPEARGAPQGAVGVPTPELTRPAFDDARSGLQAGTVQQGIGQEQQGIGQEQPTDPSEGEIVALPGQFMGGDFAQETVRAPTRTFAGREYEIDPTQTKEARDEQERADDLKALIAAGIPEAEALAMLRTAPSAIPSHLQAEKPGVVRRNDPMRGEFENEEARAAFIQFRGDLAAATASGGRGSTRAASGPITVKNALEELDQMYGEFDRSGNIIGHQLGERERFRLATLWSEGKLTEDQLPEPATEEAPPEEENEPGFFRQLINRLDPRVDRLGRPHGSHADGGQDPGEGTQRAGPLSSGARAAPGGSDIVADSLRSIVREFSTKVGEARLREILLDEGYTAEQIAAALRGG